MKTAFLFLFLLSARAGCAQVVELNYGPMSDGAWGKLTKVSRINLSFLMNAGSLGSLNYKPGIRYSIIDSNSDMVDEFDHHVDGVFHFLFLMPASFDIPFGKFSYINRMGFGFSDNIFPNENGLRLNFLLEVGLSYSITKPVAFSMRYSHISNGYRGRINPGLDNVLIGTSFSF